MKLAVIVTGGTISCVGEPLAPLPAAEFARACVRMLGATIAAELPKAEVEFVTDLAFPGAPTGTLDSTNLTPEDWCVLAQRIVADDRDVDGWVVLHGTDTLQYTSAALAFLLSAFGQDGEPLAALDAPVVVTGSQRPLFQRAAGGALALRADSDASKNLLDALRAASSGRTGVRVAFGGKLLEGTRVVKTSTVEAAGFCSPNAPEISRAQDGAAAGLNAPRRGLRAPAVRALMTARLEHIRRTIRHRPVMTLAAFPTAGASPSATSFLASAIRLAVREGAQGLVLESYGNGNYPSGHPVDPARGDVAREVAAAVAAGVTCVAVSQVLHGGLAGTAYLAGSWMRDVGVVSGADMTASAALAKLTVLRAEVGWAQGGRTAGVVATLMAMNLTGEMTVERDAADDPVTIDAA